MLTMIDNFLKITNDFKGAIVAVRASKKKKKKKLRFFVEK